jgi:hypothetical protein
MDVLSPTPDARSRKNIAFILNRLATVGLERAGEAIGKDNTTISRMKEKALPELAMLLAALGLKVIPVGYRCVDADTYKTMKRLAIERLQEEDDGSRLEWD